VTASEAYRELAEAAWSWVLSYVREDDGVWLPATVWEDWREKGPAEDRDSLYAGIAGLAPVLAEIARYRALRDVEQTLANRVVARLSAQATVRREPSLYDGLAGDVTALKLLSPGAEAIALGRLADLRTPAGWNTTLEFEPGSDAPLTDLVMGTAGIVMAAVWAGGGHAETIAATGGEALLRAADRTEAGLDWGMAPGSASRGPNYSHGTAGVAAALAIAGVALHRREFIEAATEGAQHLLAVGSLDNDGFIVPHTIPPSKRDVEPVTYTWCHGASRYVLPVRGVVARRRRRCRWSGGHRAATAMPQLDPRLRLYRGGSAPGSGTTTAVAAAPLALARCSWTPRRTARTPSGPTSSGGRPNHG